LIILSLGTVSSLLTLFSYYVPSYSGSGSFFASYNFVAYIIRSIQALAFSYRAILAVSLLSGFLWAPIFHVVQSRVTWRRAPSSGNLVDNKLLTSVSILAIASFIVFLQLYTRLSLARPSGYDTLAYIYWINLTTSQGLSWPLFNNPTPLAIYFFSGSKVISGIPSDELFKFLPAIILATYAASTYLLLRVLLGQEDHAYSRIPSTFGFVFAGISATSLLFSLDLYRNLLGLVLQNIFMVFLVLTIRQYKPKWLALTSICLTVELLTYWPLFIITLAQLLVFSALSMMIGAQRSRIVSLNFLALLPALVVSYAFLLIQYSYPMSNTMVKNFLWAVFPPSGLLSQGDVGVFGHPSIVPTFPDDSQRLMIGMFSASTGNPLPALLALASFPSLARLRDERMRLLFAYVIALSALILSPVGIKDAYGVRLPLIFPVVVLAAVGIRNIMQLILRPSLHIPVPKILRNPRLGIATLSVILALVLVITLQTGIEFQNAHAGSGAGLSDIGMRELSRIKEHFGLANNHVILVIRGHDNWANSLYIVSPVAYYTGTLAYLLINKTEPANIIQDFGTYVVSIQSLQTSGALRNLSAHTIVLTEHTYGPSDVEKQFLREIDQGIFVVPDQVVRNPGEMFRSWAIESGLNDTTAVSRNIPDLSSFKLGFSPTIVIGTATICLVLCLSSAGVLIKKRRGVRAIGNS
jgi:hypothetical protein